MVTHLEKSRLAGEREALCDETAEESRLGNITGKQTEQIINLIYKKHNECIEALHEQPDTNIDEVIKAYRGLIRQILKTPNPL